MRPFIYARAEDADAAIAVSGADADGERRHQCGASQYLAGGTTLHRPDEARCDAAATRHRHQRACSTPAGADRIGAERLCGSARWRAWRRPPTIPTCAAISR